MALRQYVGARYVPKFSDVNGGEWDNTYTYEPLTIVKHGNDYYTSKKEVPTGIAITNTEYWILTGNYNGAISELQDEIDDINTTLTAYDEKIEKNTRKALFFGNSYAIGNAGESGKGLYYEARGLFADSKLYYEGGVGFLPYTNHTNTFGTLLNTAIADTSGIDHEEVTDIVILSAWGDTLALKAGGQTAWSDIQTAMQSFVSAAKGAYTNLVSIKLAFVETRSTRTITGTAEGTSYYNEPFEANAVMHILSERCGIEYIGWVSWDAFMNGNMTQNDNYHPNSLGNKTIGASLRAALDGSLVYYPKKLSFDATCAIVPSGSVKVIGYITPYTAHINFAGVSMSAGNTIAQYATDTLFALANPTETSVSAIPACFMPASPSNGNRGIIRLVASPGVGDDLTLLATETNNSGVVKINGQLFNAQTTVTQKVNGGVSTGGIEFVFEP